MTIKVYTKEDKVRGIDLEVEVSEYFVIQTALARLAGDIDANLEDRMLAVMMTEAFKDKEQVELDEFN